MLKQILDQYRAQGVETTYSLKVCWGLEVTFTSCTDVVFINMFPICIAMEPPVASTATIATLACGAAVSFPAMFEQVFP